ncbi:helix-hairpin-helix domain-containing protein [Qipengyuania sp. ASV99]|uniref:helix-hairpin-helix domain-containing protein n=1 Tax=Qipengyuania sp. ASV99 TaxID=3399681 RepID=UPI003A4C504C
MSPQTLQAGVLIALGVVLVILAIWFLMRANRKTRVVGDGSVRKDVLDEGAARAARNQALIDAPVATATDSAAPAAPIPAPPPAPTTAPAPTATLASNTPDDLRRIKGVGPKLATLLNEQGITSFVQIAAWDAADIERVDAVLGRFAGRITRDQWTEQAKLLSAGDEAGFAAKFGSTK